MSDLHLRRVFLATLIGSAFSLSACTSTLRTAEPSLAVPVTTTAAIPAIPSAVTDPLSLALSEAVAQRLAEEAVAGEAVEPPPAPYRDVYDRIRKGFQLEDPDQRAVDSQLTWFVKHPDYLERTFARGELYLHYIVSELEARKLPLELALLPVVESAYEPFGYSHARAAGLWQFIAGTGKRFGLKQNWWYDGRRDVVESTRAAMDYLEFLHAEFNGDWLLAIAAYNCGEMNVQRAVQRNLASGKPTDFWSLKLPKETRAYVPKLLAMRRVVEYPADYGIELMAVPDEPYFASVDTGGQIDLKLASELAGITHEELANLNPAFNRWATDPEGPHRLLVPIDSSDLFVESLAQVPTAERVRTTSYKVAPGESLTQVAKRTGTSASVIKQINSLSGTKLHAGQELLIPANTVLPAKVAMAAARHDRTGGAVRGRYHVVRRGETLSTIARRYGMSTRTLAARNHMQPTDMLRAGRKLSLRPGSTPTVASTSARDGGSHATYTVVRGDTLTHIAKRFSVSVAQLLSWNGLSRSTRLMPGQRLTVRPG